MSSSKQALDHLILFVPVNTKTKLPEVPAFFKDNFTLSAGGFHADGATSNVLILLADGCYIELISFINPDIAPDHWWGPDAGFVGWKDWCLTNNISPESNYENIKTTHGQPNHGGRKRPDGVDVKWAVTFPKGDRGGQDVRGLTPFFCHDITPRNVRVAIDDSNTTHSSGALGVRQITIIVKDQALHDKTRSVYASIFGNNGTAERDEVYFHAGRVHESQDLGGGAKITLRLPRNNEELEQTEKSGFSYGNVVLGAKAQPEQPFGTQRRLDGLREESSVGGLWIEYL